MPFFFLLFLMVYGHLTHIDILKTSFIPIAFVLYGDWNKKNNDILYYISMTHLDQLILVMCFMVMIYKYFVANIGDEITCIYFFSFGQLV